MSCQVYVNSVLCLIFLFYMYVPSFEVNFPKTTIIYSITKSPASLQIYIKCWAKPDAAVADGRKADAAAASWNERTIVVVIAGLC